MKRYKGTIIEKDKHIMERHSNDGICMLMPLSSNPSFVTKRRYLLNKTAAEVMFFLVKRRKFEEIYDYLKSKYQKENQVKIKTELKLLLSELEKEGFVIVKRKKSMP